MLIPANTSEAQERNRQQMLALRSPSVNVTTCDMLMPLPPSLPGGRGLFLLIPVITDVNGNESSAGVNQPQAVARAILP